MKRLLVACAMMATSPALAEAPLVEDAKALNTLGHCLAGERSDEAERAMALAFGSAEQAEAATKFLAPENTCFEGDASFDFEPNLLIGAMAERLFLNRFGKMDVSALASAPVEPRNDVEDLGLCVVHRNPAGVRALIASPPFSQSEAKSVAAMVPDIGPCVPQGMELALSKPRMRALFAASLYRAAAASR